MSKIGESEMSLTTVISFVAITLSSPLLVYNGYWMLKNRGMVRRFFKLLITGKYEPPTEN